jgi:histidinol phosphatase-like PHP family hydrolase
MEKQIMTRPYSRRRFLETSFLAGAALAGRPISGAAVARAMEPPSPPRPSFPVADYHVHLSPTLSIKEALALGRERQVQIGIVEHPGPGFPINTDADLTRYIEGLRRYPVRIGLQPVYAGWSKSFSKSALDELDYVLMDALTLPRPEGGWLAIWQIDTMVDDEEAFMARYMRFIEQVLTTEPIDIFAWPTFLPVPIAREYKELWTPQRVQHIISLCRDRAHGPRDRKIAIEINEVAHVPDESFILQAKRAGLKFTFGTDARNQNAAHFYYCYRMAQKCGLAEADMFVPGRSRAASHPST